MTVMDEVIPGIERESLCLELQKNGKDDDVERLIMMEDESDDDNEDYKTKKVMTVLRY